MEKDDSCKVTFDAMVNTMSPINLLKNEYVPIDLSVNKLATPLRIASPE